MNKNEFLGLLKESVRYSPTITIGSNEIQMQTFGVLRSPAELVSESLEKTPFDKDKNYFFSRKWEAFNHNPNRIVFDYPILVAYDVNPRLQNVFSGKGRKLTTFRIDCMYPNFIKAGPEIKKQCKNLLIPEIYVLADAFLQYVINYVKNAVYATTTTGADTTDPAWHNLSRLQYLLANGDIDSYDIVLSETSAYQRRMKENNEQVSGRYVDDESKDVLCGVSYTVVLSETACDFDASNFDVLNCC